MEAYGKEIRLPVPLIWILLLESINVCGICVDLDHQLGLHYLPKCHFGDIRHELFNDLGTTSDEPLGVVRIGHFRICMFLTVITLWANSADDKLIT